MLGAGGYPQGFFEFHVEPSVLRWLEPDMASQMATWGGEEAPGTRGQPWQSLRCMKS